MSEQQKYNDESAFVALLKSKSNEGLEQLYDRYSDSIYGVIYAIVKNQGVAEDLLQETFIKVWKNIDSYDSSKGRLFTWMLNIARNRSIDYKRSKHYKKSLKVQSIQNAVNDPADTNNNIKEETIGMQGLVNELDTKYRNVIEKIYFQGYTQQELADEMDIPLGTVKTRIRKAILLLRSVFKI